MPVLFPIFSVFALVVIAIGARVLLTSNRFKMRRADRIERTRARGVALQKQIELDAALARVYALAELQ